VRRSVTVKREGRGIGGSEREVGQVITVRQVTATKCCMAAESNLMTSQTQPLELVAIMNTNESRNIMTHYVIITKSNRITVL
jgi:hypothetical protein